MKFKGRNGSMGYLHGMTYKLQIYRPELLERILNRGIALAVQDIDGRGLYCPYSVEGFSANWEVVT